MTAISTAPTETESPLSLLFPDLESELATTRRILERVPDGKDDWRPHEKSMTLDGLATHLAQLPGFGLAMLTTDEFDVGNRPRPKVANSADRLKVFDELATDVKKRFGELTWDRARATWKMTFGDRVVFNGPRAVVLRSALITHMAHHRAQLGVYLRLLGVPIPGSYGPSADEAIGIK
jgi:uncharacterized damage-inducible protein DinB